MPLILANSKDGQVHKDKHFNTNTKILSEACALQSSDIYFFYMNYGCFFLDMSNVMVKRFSSNKMILSQGIFIWNMITLVHTVQKLLASLKFSKSRSRSRSQGQRCQYPQKGLVTKNSHIKYQSSSTHCSKVISKIKFSKSRSNSKVKVTRS